MAGPSILVIEDDPELRGILLRALDEHGFTPTGAGTGAEALTRVGDPAPDAVVIDIGLSDADGRDLCQTLRARGLGAPVLFLTARDAVVDRLAGFDAGGDDYVVKPFDLDELVARLHALLRRAGSDQAVEAGALRLDPIAHAASCGGETIPLTPTEFRLLGTLAGRPGEPVRRRDLVRAGWVHGAIVHDNSLDVYVARLRRKLRRLPGAPVIRTVHGVGYRLE